MTRLISLALAATLLAVPATAQESEERSLLEEGAELMFRGLIEEVTPPLQELAGIGQDLLPTFQLLAEEMGPALAEVLGRIDSIAYYEPPALLPNGDIILRRSADAPPWVPPPPVAEQEEAPEPDGEPTPDDFRAPDRADPDLGSEEEPSPFDLTPPPEAEPDLRLDPTLRLDPEGGLDL